MTELKTIRFSPAPWTKLLLDSGDWRLSSAAGRIADVQGSDDANCIQAVPVLIECLKLTQDMMTLSNCFAQGRMLEALPILREYERLALFDAQNDPVPLVMQKLGAYFHRKREEAFHIMEGGEQ